MSGYAATSWLKVTNTLLPLLQQQKMFTHVNAILHQRRTLSESKIKASAASPYPNVITAHIARAPPTGRTDSQPPTKPPTDTTAPPTDRQLARLPTAADRPPTDRRPPTIYWGIQTLGFGLKNNRPGHVDEKIYVYIISTGISSWLVGPRPRHAAQCRKSHGAG